MDLMGPKPSVSQRASPRREFACEKVWRLRIRASRPEIMVDECVGDYASNEADWARVANMFSLTNRAIGTMLQAAPTFANQGTCLSCSLFARIIVALLVEAEAPQLEHLWVFADDEPCTNSEARNGHHRQKTKLDEENHDADECDRPLFSQPSALLPIVIHREEIL